ncbi:MAG: hypothetical protein CL912_04655 [Deltaproteobacteria bacterium]|nr:hypothetical protein [Deltaproteobacteria bacterium]
MTLKALIFSCSTYFGIRFVDTLHAHSQVYQQRPRQETGGSIYEVHCSEMSSSSIDYVLNADLRTEFTLENIVQQHSVPSFSCKKSLPRSRPASRSGGTGMSTTNRKNR